MKLSFSRVVERQALSRPRRRLILFGAVLLRAGLPAVYPDSDDNVASPAGGDAQAVEWQEDAFLPGYGRAALAGAVTGTGTANAARYSFEVETGDQYTVYMESYNTTGAPQIRILNAQGSAVASAGGNPGGYARLQNFAAPSPGTYTLELYFNTQPGPFRALVMRGRALQMEIEPNNVQADATRLQMTGVAGALSHRWAGMLDSFEGADVYDLGILGAGAGVEATLLPPTASSLRADGPRLSLRREGGAEPVAASQSGVLLHTLAAAGRYFLQLDLTGPAAFLALDGGGWVDLGNPEALRITGDQTIEYWIRPDNLSARRNPWAKAYAGEGTMTLETDGSVNYYYGTGGGNNSPYQTFTNTYRLPVGVWTHLALVRNLSAGTPTLYWYVNGQPWNTAAASYPLAAASSLSAFIGQGHVSRMIGGIGAMRVWNRALSAAEIAAGRDKEVPALADTTGLAAGWDFVPAEGSTLPDLSPNAVNGAIQGTAVRVASGVAVPMSAAQRGWQADYNIALSVTDTEPPAVVSVSLPDSGTATQELFFVVTAVFSKTLHPVAAVQAAHYELRGAGQDALFGTADDVLYTLVPAFDGRETVSLTIVEAPLVPGIYSFTVLPTLTDRLGNGLADAFVRTFMVEPAGAYTTETVGNTDFASATRLGTPTGRFDGSYTAAAATLAGGASLWAVRAADLDGDGRPDLAALRYNPSQLLLYHGLGGASFAEPVVIGLPSGAYDLAIADFFGNGRADLAVTCRDGARVIVLRNTGTGDLAARYETVVNLAVTGQPMQLAVADFNGDGWPDLAMGHNTGGVFTVLLNTGADGFSVQTVATGITRGIGIAAGDLDRDGDADLVVAHPDNRLVQVFLNDGAAGFSAAGQHTVSTSNRNPHCIALHDLNGSGNLDLVVAYEYNDRLDVFAGDGAGGFGPAQEVGLPNGFRTCQRVAIADHGSGLPVQILLGGSNGPTVISSAHTGGAGFALTPVHHRDLGEIYGLASADLDGDGLPDLVMAVYNAGVLRFAYGNERHTLAPDAVLGADLLQGPARGLLLQPGEADYWSFSIDAPRRAIIAAHTLLPSVYYSRMRVRVYGPGQYELGSFITGVSSGQGQGNFHLDAPGRYYVRAEYYDGNWQGEYRIRLSIVPPDDQLEAEGNDSIGAANPLAFPLSGSTQVARVWGGIATGDGNGDYFRRPRLGPGTLISLRLSIPASSGLLPRLRVYDGGSIEVIAGALGLTELDYLIGDTSTPPYYVRVEGDAATRGLHAEYRLQVTLSDTTPPLITACSLPEAPTTALPNRFTLSFNEDMLPASVNNPAHYELRGRGPDGAWNTADDTLYPVALWSAYESGQQAGYWLPGGPMPPDVYRFTATTGLADRFGNGLSAPFSHTFALLALDPFRIEVEPNDSFAAANPTGPEDPRWSGYFSPPGQVAATQNNPWRVAVADFDGDGAPDAATACSGSNSLQVFLADGAGGFGGPASFGLGGTPSDVVVGDWNQDGRPDIAVSVRTAGKVLVFLNSGDASGGGTAAKAR